MWIKERENLATRITKELLPEIREQAQEEVTTEYQERVRAGVYLPKHVYMCFKVVNSNYAWYFG